MDKSWTRRIQDLEAWHRDIASEFPDNDLHAASVAFDECVQDALTLVRDFNGRFVVFDPTSWVSEPDWLLTDGQWRYL